MPITEGPSTSTERKTELEDKKEEKLEEETAEEPVSLHVRTGLGTGPRSAKSALEEETPRSSSPEESNPVKKVGSGLERERDSESPLETQSTLPWQRVSVNQEKRGEAEGEEIGEEKAREEETGQEEAREEVAGEVVEKAGEAGVSWDIVITVVASSVSSVFLIFTVSIKV